MLKDMLTYVYMHVNVTYIDNLKQTFLSVIYLFFLHFERLSDCLAAIFGLEMRLDFKIFVISSGFRFDLNSNLISALI